MMLDEDGFSERVEAAVAAIETTTDAEVVVVASTSSSGYRDARMALATGLVFALYLAALLVPWHVDPRWILVDLAVTWWAVFLVSGRGGFLRSLPVARLDHAIGRAARVVFFDEAVADTPNRSGVLVYISCLERRVEILMDDGAAGKVPSGLLHDPRLAFEDHTLDGFLRGLELLGDVLAQCLPHTPESDLVDLPNAPRILR